MKKNKNEETSANDDLTCERINDNWVRLVGSEEGKNVPLNVFVLTPKQSEKAQRDFDAVVERNSTK